MAVRVAVGADRTRIVRQLVTEGVLIFMLGAGAALVGVLSTLIGRFHGGPAQVGVLSSTLFGGVSGSAVADASAIGSLLIPWHKRLGYPAAFSAATLAAAATIDILIPPSIPMILFALTSNASIASLFVAGVLPAVAGLVADLDRGHGLRPAADGATHAGAGRLGGGWQGSALRKQVCV